MEKSILNGITKHNHFRPLYQSTFIIWYPQLEQFYGLHALANGN